MGHLDLVNLALSSMRKKQLRTWLTVIGIVIGIGAIVSLVSIGQGLQEYLNVQLNSFGTDYLIVQPGSLQSISSSNPILSAVKPLSENERKAIESIGGVQKVYGEIDDTMSIQFSGQQGKVLAIGDTPGIFDAFPFYTLSTGRFYTSGNNEVVLGSDLANNVFKKKIRMGDTIALNNVTFRVVGILEEQTGLYSSANSVALLEVGDMSRALGTSRTALEYDQINAKLQPGSDADAVGTAIEQRLRNMRHETNDTQDFTVITPAFITNTANSILGTLNLVLGGLAGISLVVGGIGIANTMFMSVMERTREIGTLKAIGATEGAIMELFIIESGLLGVVGGLLGCLIGLLVSFGMNQFGVPSKVDLPLVSYAMLFSFAVGMASGVFPARRAAKLEPVEALRYE